MNAQEILQTLQTLDAQNPGAWPKWVRVAAVIATGVLVLILGGWLLIKPVHESVQAARAQERTLLQELDDKQKKVAAIDAYREQLKEMERQFGAMLKQLPSRAEVANLLNDISQKRVEASLEEELFQPIGEIPKDFYAAIPNKIVVVGDYHEMGIFVSEVAALPRIVTIEDVEIRGASSSGPGSGGPTLLRMTATAQTYRYLDEAEIAAANPQTQPRGRR
ncbi:type 4a pilus biogenesis protein PilO [Sinimarinibacterium thermocellulolyticum]|uniref:Type 4a pilus biogenesis protein PilO n=1 Tax=Sinimarinibacterium thermocellulolyticum TaxID=3170016 RepID=A0ABV2AC81_9GAMM